MPDPVNLAYAWKLPAREMMEYFSGKGYQITWNWWEMWQEAHTKAFTVAKATSIDILQDIRSALDEALAEGQTVREFSKNLAPVLQRKGWWGRLPVLDPDTGDPMFRADGTPMTYQAGSPWRLENIYRTNKRTAASSGRYRAQRDAAALAPFLEYVAIMDNRTRPGHAAMDGRVYPADDPIWQNFYPPNGWGCRCRVIARTQAEVDRRNLQVRSSDGEIEPITQTLKDSRTGETTEVQGWKWKDADTGEELIPDAGWSYNPGAAGAARLRELLGEKAGELGVIVPEPPPLQDQTPPPPELEDADE